MEEKFNALWGGNQIFFSYAGIDYKFNTEIYVKGFDIPVVMELYDDMWNCSDLSGNKVKLVSGYKYEGIFCN